MPEITDEEMVKQAQHDPHAFGALYDRFADRIYAFACRITGDPTTAQDITAAAFEKALTHLDRFQWRGISVCAWLYRLARSEAVRLYRKERFLAPFDDRLPVDLDIEGCIQTGQRSLTLRKAFVRLGRSDRELLILRFYEDLSSGEVAQALGVPPPVLYLRLHRALRRLRRKVEELEGQEQLKGEEAYVEA